MNLAIKTTPAPHSVIRAVFTSPGNEIHYRAGDSSMDSIGTNPKSPWYGTDMALPSAHGVSILLSLGATVDQAAPWIKSITGGVAHLDSGSRVALPADEARSLLTALST